MTICSVVSTICSGNIYAVTNKPLITGSCLPDGALSVLVNIVTYVLCIVDDSGLAVLEDSKKVVVILSTEGNSVDISNAHRLTRGHVVEGGIDTCYYIVVFADKLRILGIAVLLISIGNLICQLVHTHNAVLMLLQIRSLNDNVIAGNIRSGYIVDHLLSVLGIGIIYILVYAGRKS